MMKDNENNNDINQIIAEYEPHPDDIFNEDTAFVSVIKDTIFTKLTEAEKRVILLYAELGTQRDVARLLGVSASSINIYIKKIRVKLAQIMLNKNVLDTTDSNKCNNLLLD